MDWVGWIERFGEPAVLAACGLLAGLGFGFFAQRSRFCLRAAVIEFWHGKFGDKLTVWLLAFGSAVVGAGGGGLSGRRWWVCSCSSFLARWTGAPRASSRRAAACRALCWAASSSAWAW